MIVRGWQVVNASAQIVTVLGQKEKRHATVDLLSLQTSQHRFQFKSNEATDKHYLLSSPPRLDELPCFVVGMSNLTVLTSVGPKDQFCQAY